MTDEMATAYQKKLETADYAKQVLLTMIQSEGGSSGHVGFLAQRAFAIAEEFVKFSYEYTEGKPEFDDMAKVGMAPGIGGKS